MWSAFALLVIESNVFSSVLTSVLQMCSTVEYLVRGRRVDFCGDNISCSLGVGVGTGRNMSG